MKTIRHRRQRGATLLVSLIMLVVLTMFAVTGFNLSSVNLKIAGNFQQQRYIEAVVQQAIEQVLNTGAAFSVTPAPQTITIDGIAVAVAAGQVQLLHYRGRLYQEARRTRAGGYRVGSQRLRDGQLQQRHCGDYPGRTRPPVGRQLPLEFTE